MKKLLFSLIFVISNINFANAEVVHPFPNGNILSNGRCSFGTTNCAGNGYHLGVDLMGRSGSKVVSMCPGKVKHNNTQTRGIWDSKLIIEHDCNGKTIYGIYGHILSVLNPNDPIGAGETVGTLKDDGNNSHLHMGVSKKYSTTNWGYGTKYDVQNIFLNFEKVLNYPLITQRTNASVFDGAGSLIKPDGSCYGCDKDAADMQSHDIPSTVVFQWKSIDNCNYLNIGVSDDWKVGDSPLDVVIHTKYWDDHKSISYKTTLPISVRSEGVWNTTAITSQKKLSSSVRLIAECSKTAMQGGGEDIANKFVDLSNGYLWAGNGSIITRALDSKTTGRTQDWAEVFDKNKSMTAFQWDASSACSSLLLEPDWEGVTGQENVIQVDMKSWSQEKWPDNHLCNGKLPCTINAPDNNYYIIKIKTKGGEISSGLIHAKCI